MRALASEPLFSESYGQARERFRAAGRRAGAELVALEAGRDGDVELTIDGLFLGASDASSVLLVTSGVHGVEGFVGSALQLALLSRWEHWRTPRVAWCLVHSINPFGMRHGRRWNANNVDLNRNFHDGRVPLSCDDERVERLHKVIGGVEPKTGPWWVTLAALSAQNGVSWARRAIAEGQFFYPKGLFFGGQAVQNETQRVREYLDRKLGAVRRIVHLDVHSGLGRWGQGSLYVHAPRAHAVVRDVEAIFGRPLVRSFGGVYEAIQIRGGFVEETRHRFARATVTAATLEFGVKSPLAVLSALREENRATQLGAASTLRRARERLRGCFSSSDPAWREKCIEAGLGILQRAQSELQG